MHTLDLSIQMRNYNTTSDLTTFAVINQDLSYETSGPLWRPSSFGISMAVQPDRVEWSFDQSGKDLVVGKTFNLLGRLRLNRHATAKQYVWRSYCETKQPPGRKSWYYFKSWMEVRFGRLLFFFKTSIAPCYISSAYCSN